ncbi:MAG: hypothetical protein JW919_00460 [Candidatus Omnitrophica bacterium]|nr:hypothetical protein [Candidatus Omnitrophota bacterium]
MGVEDAARAVIYTTLRARRKLYRSRVLIFAILFSLFLHVFWIVVVKIVATHPASERVKFSKVSFLGSILERGMLEVRIEPRQRDPLEKRYLSDVDTLTRGFMARQARGGCEDRAGEASFRGADEALPARIKDAISGPKAQPAYLTE